MLRTKISEIDVAVGTGKKPPQAFCACRKWPWPKGLAWHSSMSKSMRRARTASVQAGRLRLPSSSAPDPDPCSTKTKPARPRRLAPSSWGRYRYVQGEAYGAGLLEPQVTDRLEKSGSDRRIPKDSPPLKHLCAAAAL